MLKGQSPDRLQPLLQTSFTPWAASSSQHILALGAHQPLVHSKPIPGYLFPEFPTVTWARHTFSLSLQPWESMYLPQQSPAVHVSLSHTAVSRTPIPTPGPRLSCCGHFQVGSEVLRQIHFMWSSWALPSLGQSSGTRQVLEEPAGASCLAALRRKLERRKNGGRDAVFIDLTMTV